MGTSDEISTTVQDLLTEHPGFNVKQELGGLRIDLVVENDEISVRLAHGKSATTKIFSLGKMIDYAWDIKYGTRGTIKVVAAVKFVRQVTGWGLKTAKKYVDAL